jgi:hypothetical protein
MNRTEHASHFYDIHFLQLVVSPYSITIIYNFQTMNIYLHLSSHRFRGMYLSASLNVIMTTFTFAQQAAPVIKGAKTDNNYANTTEISKAKNATDEQVLDQIEGNYGLGDIVRIVITTPKPTTPPLTNTGTGKPTSSIKMPPPAFPNGMITPPIGNLPVPQQETTPPQYNVPETPIATTPTANRPTTPNGQLTPIGNRPAPQQGTTPPQYNRDGQPMATVPNANRANPNGQFTPINNRPTPQQTAAAPPIVYEYYNTKGEQIAPPNSKGVFDFTPLNKRPAPQQTTASTPIKYEYYNTKGQLIPPPNGNGQTPPIGNRPAPQQGTTPPQYNSDGQPIATTPTSNRPTNPNGQLAPIGNRPAPQQGITPPQYNSDGQPIATTPTANRPTNPNGQLEPIGNRPAPQQGITPPQYNKDGQPIPDNNSSITASTSDKVDLTSFFENKTPVVEKKEQVIEKEVITQKSVELVEQREGTERTRSSETSRAERSPSRAERSPVSSGNKAAKASGFSLKSPFSFSGLGKSNLKETKRRNMKTHKKYGCYKFN